MARTTRLPLDSQYSRLAFLAILSCAYARDWRDVVDPDLYEWMDFDVQKLAVMAEIDPFQVSYYPTIAPTSVPEFDSVERPTTAGPTVTPTLAPSAVWGMVDQNGGCPEGQVLHEIRMTDSWGDGWDETMLTITRLVDVSNVPGVLQKVETKYGTTVSEIIPVRQPVGSDPSFPQQVYRGSLATGSEGFAYVCLERKQCYEVSAEGGFWQQEVAWGIREVQLGLPREESPDSLLLAKGNAPENCQISVSDQLTGDRICPVTCGVRTHTPTTTPTTSRPSVSPTKRPTSPLIVTSTDTPTAEQTFMNNILPDDGPPQSSVPSDMPSLVPTSQGIGRLPTLAPQQDAQPNTKVSEVPSDAPSLVPTGAPSRDNPFGPYGFGGLGGGFGFGGRE